MSTIVYSVQIITKCGKAYKAKRADQVLKAMQAKDIYLGTGRVYATIESKKSRVDLKALIEYNLLLADLHGAIETIVIVDTGVRIREQLELFYDKDDDKTPKQFNFGGWNIPII